MPNAYLAIHASAGTSLDVLAKLNDIEAVSEAHVVAGNYDIIAELVASSTGDLLPVVTREIQGIEGIGATRTYIVLD